MAISSTGDSEHGYGGFDRYTGAAIKVMQQAQGESRKEGHNKIDSEHILLGLLCIREGAAFAALKETGISMKMARTEVQNFVVLGSNFEVAEIGFTSGAKRVLELAWTAARELEHSYIGTEHLLLGSIRQGNGVAVSVLRNLEIDLCKLEDHVVRNLSRREFRFMSIEEGK